MSFTPNEISPGRQIAAVCMSALFLGWATYGVLIDDLFIPAGRSGGTGSHLHGAAAWIVFAAVVCFVSRWLSAVVDHYDIRDNEATYRRFQEFAWVASFCLLILAAVIDRWR